MMLQLSQAVLYLLILCITLSTNRGEITVELVLRRGPIDISSHYGTVASFSSLDFKCTWHKLNFVTPANGCSASLPLASAEGNRRNTYYIVTRGGCSLHSKAGMAAERRDAAGIVIINTDDSTFVAAADPSMKNLDQRNWEKICRARNRDNEMINEKVLHEYCSQESPTSMSMSIVAVMVGKNTLASWQRDIDADPLTRSQLGVRIAPEGFCGNSNSGNATLRSGGGYGGVNSMGSIYIEEGTPVDATTRQTSSQEKNKPSPIVVNYRVQEVERDFSFGESNFDNVGGDVTNAPTSHSASLTESLKSEYENSPSLLIEPAAAATQETERERDVGELENSNSHEELRLLCELLLPRGGEMMPQRQRGRLIMAAKEKYPQYFLTKTAGMREENELEKPSEDGDLAFCSKVGAKEIFKSQKEKVPTQTPIHSQVTFLSDEL